MSASTVPAARPWPLAAARRHWRLLAVLTLGLGPFVPSIVAMQDFLLADNALGFTPFALVAAVYLFWVRAHHVDGPKSRDILVDSFFIGPLVGVTLFILFVVPASQSWYFWLNRMDLAALAPWAMAVGFAFLGYQQVLRTWPAWVMLAFAWPYPAVQLQGMLSDVFVPITAQAGRFVAEFAHLSYSPSDDPQVFTSTHLPEGENFTLVVGQLCSGTSTTIGFLIVGGALMLMTRGTAGARVRWLLTGVALAFVSNLVRVSALLIAATEVSREFAVDTLHPILGLILFAFTVLLMLLLMGPFHLRFDPVPHGRRLAWEPAPGGGKALRFAWVLVLAAALGAGAGVTQAQELDFIGIGDGAPAVSVASERGIVPEVPGWELVHETEISWTDLFGRTSRGDVFSYVQPGYIGGMARIGVQTVVTEDKETLDRYTLEQCIEFHNRDLAARRAVDLGYGLTGYVLHDTFEDVDGAILYWVMPVNVDGEVRHARIALFGDEVDPSSYDGLDMGAGRASAAAVRLGQAIESAMDGLPDGVDDPVRDRIDRDLTALAVTMIDTMIQTGGPAEFLDESGLEDGATEGGATEGGTVTATAQPAQ